MPDDNNTNDSTDLLNPEAIPEGETPATLRAQAARDSALDPDDIELRSRRQTGEAIARSTDEGRRELAAASSEQFGANDLRVEDGQVHVSDEAMRRRAAAQSELFGADDLRVTNDGRVEYAGDPAPEKVQVSLWDNSDPSGEVAWVAPDGQRIETGQRASAGDDPYFARVDVPDREGEWRLQIGDDTVRTVDVGPVGAGRDVSQSELSSGWNGNIIELDESEGSGSLAQADYDPDDRYTSASEDPDVVSAGDAARALNEGVSADQLQQNQALAAQVDRQTEPDLRVQLGDVEGGPEGNPAQQDSEASQAIREEIAGSVDGVGAEDLDLVQTSSGLRARVDAEARDIDPGAATEAAQELGVGEAPGALNRLDGDAERGVSVTRPGGQGGVATGAPDPDRRGVDIEVGDADRGVGVTRGPEGTTIVRPEQDVGEVTRISQQQLDAQRGPSQGDVRAAVNRYGQRQLDQRNLGVFPEASATGGSAGAVDYFLGANENPAVSEVLTDSGGVFAETDDGSAPLTDLTGFSEADLRDPSDNTILPGLLPTREEVRRGGTSRSTLFASDAEEPGSTAGEGIPERALEGTATAGLSVLNVRQRAADAEKIIEGVQNAPRASQRYGAGTVAETVTALGRQQAAQFVRRAQSEPVRTGSGIALDVAGGAVVLGRTPSAGDLRAEVDPRIGFFGETIESRALGLRNRGGEASTANVDVDRSQTRGDQVARLPGDRPQTLDTDAVDEARGVSGPSRTALARGRFERGMSRVQRRVREEMDRIEINSRLGAGLGGAELRRETPDSTPDAPTGFDPSRTEILAGSPRDRLSDDIAERELERRRQATGTFERGELEPSGDDGVTFDPTADADARRREAERSTVFELDEPKLDATPETQLFGRRGIGGGIGGGVLASALGRDKQAQQPSLVDGSPAFGGTQRTPVDTDPVGDLDRSQDIDMAPDVDTRLDQDTRQDIDTRQDMDTRRDLDTRRGVDTRDPDPRDPDRNDFDRLDLDTDPDIDMPPRDIDTGTPRYQSDGDERRGGFFSGLFGERSFDSGIADADEALDSLFGSPDDGDRGEPERDLTADDVQEFEFRF